MDSESLFSLNFSHFTTRTLINDIWLMDFGYLKIVTELCVLFNLSNKNIFFFHSYGK